MRLMPSRSAIPRLFAIIIVAGTLLCAGIAADRLRTFSKLYETRSNKYQMIELELIKDRGVWEKMERVERELAARFRKGEWADPDDAYKKEFEGLIKTIEETHPKAFINDLRAKHFESMARSCDERADTVRQFGTSLGRKALYFGQLKRKYAQAAKAPWWTVPPDPPEPK